MDVIGSDGEHVGKVDKVAGDRIILTKSDPDSHGTHHSIPSRWIDRVEDKVIQEKTANEAHEEWRNEERRKSMSPGDENQGRGAHYLNRSFRSEEHTSELQSLMRISYAVFCLQKKNENKKSKT